MSPTFEFYDARAKEAAAEAEAATLDNVRDRNLRAEETWRALADQALKVQKDRATAAQDRKERQEREARLLEQRRQERAAEWPEAGGQGDAAE